MGGANQTTVAIGPGGVLDYRKLKVNALDELLVAFSGSSFSGTFTPTGLKTAIFVTTMDITDAASQPIPATPLTGRNSMVIQNKDAIEVLYVGPSTVTADTVNGTTSGHEINPGETFAIDITADIILYARAPAGKTIKVKVTEVA